MIFLVNAIHMISLAISLMIIADVVLSYFMSPYHPIRSAVKSIADPILNPIRRVLPQTGMLDFSPIVALIIIQILEYLLTNAILTLIR